MKSTEKYTLKEYRPSETLIGFIDEFYEFWFKKSKELIPRPYFFPNYSTALIYYRDNISGESEFYFIGPCMKNIFLPSSADCYYWAVDFHPFITQSIFKFNISSLVDKIVKAKNLMTKKDFETFYDYLNKIKTCRGKIKFLEDFVSKRISDIKKADIEITAVIDLVLKSNEKLKLEDIYNSLNSSTRKFQRKFKKETGLTPKEFCRIVRIRSAANKLAEGSYKHLDIMFDSGYYDQSHFNKEFKELSGSTPSSFEKRYKEIKKIKPIS